MTDTRKTHSLTTRYPARFTTRLSPALLARVRCAAAAHELRPSELIRRAVRRAVESLERSEQRERHEPAQTVQNAAR